MPDINPLTYYLFCDFIHFFFLFCINANNIKMIIAVLPTLPELPGVSRISQPFCLELPAPGSFQEIHGISII